MSDLFCNGTHLSMDDTFIQWNEILGDPSTSTALNGFVDLKIKGVEGVFEQLIDEKFLDLTSTLSDDVNNVVDKLVLDIDPYKIAYGEGTVGNALDEIFRKKFEGEIHPMGPFELGQNFPQFIVSWRFTKNPKEQTIERIRKNAPIERHKLDVSARHFVFSNVSNTETFRVYGTDFNDKPFNIKSVVEFKHRWYYGTYSSTKPTNTVITNWTSEFVDKGTRFGKKIFDCESGSYIYYAVPDDLHLTYDFFSNGLKDTDWVYETKEVTNQYGYVHTYRIYRTNNLLHGYNIYIEVESHDWY